MYAFKKNLRTCPKVAKTPGTFTKTSSCKIIKVTLHDVKGLLKSIFFQDIWILGMLVHRYTCLALEDL